MLHCTDLVSLMEDVGGDGRDTKRGHPDVDGGDGRDTKRGHPELVVRGEKILGFGLE